MKVVESLKIKRYREDSHEDIEVSLIREAPLTIYLNAREVVTLLCLGDQMKELAVGFLGSEGFISVGACLFTAMGRGLAIDSGN